ncbi:MAG: hypothetical protein QME93_05005 [Bacillota bacterium]|nr:hypothetical protein [Bacillota bacterium]MDI7249410.1 hypothetical protein [Bacillota bacterium]
MFEPGKVDAASLKEALRQAIESGQLAQQLEQLKAAAQLGRTRLEGVESSLNSLRDLLDTVRQDLTGESTVQSSTMDLLAELLRQPAFAQLAVEVLARLLAEQKDTPAGEGGKPEPPTS